MSRIYVALDIETTGLDADRDAILEVGAVRFQGSTVLDSFETLINPKRSIPYNIQQLTGIMPEDVQSSPVIESILPALKNFVGDAPIVGHNINFDLNFLSRYGLFGQNLGIDTFELAGILLPFASRYSLTALLDYLEVDITREGDAHRALYDSHIAYGLFQALLDEARSLDYRVIQEIAHLARHARQDWPLALVFEDLAKEKPSTNLRTASPVYIQPKTNFGPILKPLETPTKLDIPALCHTIEPDGLFSQQLPEFEHRPQQVDMLAYVAESFNNSRHLIVEAGTGTGKSIAYLLPAISWAKQNEQRVVISTHTINLQDQLLEKDVPAVQQMLNTEFRAVSLKGRSNYVCPRRVQMFIEKGSHSIVELRLLSKLLVWLPQTKTGDREELFMPETLEQILWWQVASDGHVCTARTCDADSCFYARARRQAESAHIIIVNHALLMADIAVDGHIIPEYKHLVVDEAHHLEDSITQQLSADVDQRTIEQLLTELSQPARGRNQYHGFFEELSQKVIPVIPEKAKLMLVDMIELGHGYVEKALKNIERLFQATDSFAEEFTKNGRYNQKIRLTNDTRNRANWSNVELAWDNASLSMSDISKILHKFHTLLIELENYQIPHWEDLVAQVTLYRNKLDTISAQLRIIISKPTDDCIFWVEQHARTQHTSLHNAPLHVGNLFHEHLLKPKASVILTSATMQTNGSFEYLQERLHLWDVEKAAVGSPFDYYHNTLLYIPTDMPAPHSVNYPTVMARNIVSLAKEIRGRTLVLFTSYSQLKQVAEAIFEPLAAHNIAVYQQGSGASRRQLVDNFKQAEQAVLLGTRSFWEGVDVPGESLSCVVITKIPFAVPTDPVISARAETFRNAFAQYSIPLAILTFRQGFGRLIRTKNDRGVIVLFDNRVIQKNYGQAFIDSLPEVTEHRGLLGNLPEIAGQWIDHHAYQGNQFQS